MIEFSHAGDCSIHRAGSYVCDCGEFRRAIPEIDVLDEGSKELVIKHQCQVRGLTNDYIIACHFKKVYEEYIAMLNAEINSLVGIAFVHGWKSKNIKRGEGLRAEIEKANKLIE